MLLSTTKQGTSPALVHAIHFWLGKECSQDEAAGAAMLAVQLDNALSARGSDAAISRCTASSSYVSCYLKPLGVRLLRRSRQSGEHAASSWGLYGCQTSPLLYHAALENVLAAY